MTRKTHDSTPALIDSTALGVFTLFTVLTLAAVAAALPAPAQAQGDGTLAFVGGTVHPVSGPPVEDGVLVIEDGRIAAVGADVAVPPGARTVDVTGKHLYPGFVHPQTTLGLVEVSSVPGTVDVREMGDVNPNVRAEVAFNADSFQLPPAMRGGVLTAHVVPRGGLFSGTSAVMRLEGWNWKDMTLAAPAGMHLSWPRTRARPWESEEELAKRKERQLGLLDDTLADARAYGKAVAAAAVGGAPEPDFDPRLEALVPVLEGEVPLFLHADSKAEISDALDWAEENGFDHLVLVAEYDVAKLADRVAELGIPVILDGVHTRPIRDWEPYDAPFTAAARLEEAGIPFAIAATGAEAEGMNARNLPFEAATAVAFGLSRRAALEAITLRAAKILGVADRLGSLEPGKDATFFIADGDPLEIRTRIESVWVAGREIDPVTDRQWRLYRKYDDRPEPGAR
ncbi:MAG: amidohydrolase family protein [Acidobacteriota bacterium]|jgi:imidazolonepropionase-like amidohydrolase